MSKPSVSIRRFLFQPYEKLFTVFIRIYQANRQAVARLKSHRRLTGLLQVMMLLTLISWLLIWFFASEESRQRLTREFQESVQGVMPPSAH
jgi:hypothetical protein